MPFLLTTSSPTELYTLSLHDALPISGFRGPCTTAGSCPLISRMSPPEMTNDTASSAMASGRSEEHTSELQSHHDLVCRLLLEKKNPTFPRPITPSLFPYTSVPRNFLR